MPLGERAKGTDSEIQSDSQRAFRRRQVVPVKATWWRSGRDPLRPPQPLQPPLGPSWPRQTPTAPPDTLPDVLFETVNFLVYNPGMYDQFPGGWRVGIVQAIITNLVLPVMSCDSSEGSVEGGGKNLRYM